MSTSPASTAGGWPARQPLEQQVANARFMLLRLFKRKRNGRDSTLHPETGKVVERILDRLEALSDDPSVAAEREAQLPPLLAAHGWLQAGEKPSEEQAWALADSLHHLWVRTAASDALEEELARYRSPAPPSGLSPGRKRAWLLREYTAAQRAGAHERARSALRARYLRLGGYLLGALVAVAWLIAVLVVPNPAALTLCALAAAVGGALSGARALRDSSKISQTRVFQTWWWVQPIVGAAVGLFLYAVLASPVLTLPGTEATDPFAGAAATIVYAFLAGFSEPWLLGVVERLGGAADKAADSSLSHSGTSAKKEPATNPPSPPATGSSPPATAGGAAAP